MSFNCRSIRNKIPDVLCFMQESHIDIGLLQETWINQGDTSVLAEIRDYGYHVISQRRTTSDKGGGVAVMFRHGVDIKKSTVRNKYHSFELCISTLKLNGGIAKIVNLYRTPYSKNHRVTIKTFLAEFTKLLDEITQFTGTLIFTGDFNLHMENTTDSYVQQFNSILQQYALTQIIDKPTHEEGGTIDLLITTKDGSISNVNINQDKFGSDHHPILFCMKRPRSSLSAPKTTITVRNFHDINIEDFNRDIMESDLNNDKLISTLSTEEAVELYLKTLSEIVDEHSPVTTKTFKRRPTSQWFNKDLKTLKQQKRRAERKYKKSLLESDWKLFCDTRNKYNFEQKVVRSKYYKDHINNCKRDPRSMYKILDKLIGKEQDDILPDNAVNDPRCVAESFVTFFANKIDDIREDIKSTSNLECDLDAHNAKYSSNADNILFQKFHTITEEELLQLVNDMNNKSCQLDPLPTSIAKKCIGSLKKILVHIINTSLTNSDVPSVLKHATIRPTIKDRDGDNNSLKNYRPVSNTSFVSKLLEKAALTQINSYVTTNNLHAAYQSGYRKNHSCETAMIKVVNDITMMTHTGSAAILILLDLSAAFDTIDHNILINRLIQEFGIKEDVIDWIKSYLSNRTYSVKINNIDSVIKALLYGVPQGSLLGPLLFILYIKQLECIATKHGLQIHIYADDTQLYISFKPDTSLAVIETVEECLTDIKNWMLANFLKLNTDKTKIIIIRPQKNNEDLNFEIMYDNAVIEQSKTVKSLGVLLDSDMSMTSMILEKCRSCYYHLRNIGRIKYSLDHDLRILMVNNLILSKLDYCNALLANTPKFQIEKLQKVENAAVRLIFNSNRRKSAKPYLKRAHFLPIEQRIEFKLCLIVFKIVNNECPLYLTEHFKLFSPNRELRVGRDFFTLVLPNKRYHKTIFYRMIQCWNKLPLKIRTSDSVSVFKSRLKTHFFEDCF